MIDCMGSRTSSALISGFFCVVTTSVKVAAKSLFFCDEMAQKLPGASRLRGLVLDTFLGPEEFFEHTTTLTPLTFFKS